LDITGTLVDDENQILDPDENVDFIIELKNEGVIDLAEIYAVLYTDNYYVTVTDTLAYFGDIATNIDAECIENSFTINSNSLILPGMMVDFQLLKNLLEYQYTHYFH